MHLDRDMLRAFLRTFSYDYEYDRRSHFELIHHLEEVNQRLGLKILGPRFNLSLDGYVYFLWSSLDDEMYIGFRTYSIIIVHDFQIDERKLSSAILDPNDSFPFCVVYVDLSERFVACPFCDFNYCIDNDLWADEDWRYERYGTVHECKKFENFALHRLHSFIYLDATKISEDLVEKFLEALWL